MKANKERRSRDQRRYCCHHYYYYYYYHTYYTVTLALDLNGNRINAHGGVGVGERVSEPVIDVLAGGRQPRLSRFPPLLSRASLGPPRTLRCRKCSVVHPLLATGFRCGLLLLLIAYLHRPTAWDERFGRPADK